MTVEQATKGPLSRICTTTYYNKTLVAYAPPLAREDEDAINALLGCSGILSTSCSIVGTDAVICNCYRENHRRCRVTLIDFSNKGLRGRIPEKIGNIAYLETLHLTGNKLGGSIPDSFGKLKNLKELFLCDNLLGGPIPATFFPKMISLEKLYLCKNFFNETIPPELGSLHSLKILHLGYNLLSGKIPDLGNIKSLTGLYLVDNQLKDVLPDQLGKLSSLEQLWLENNKFIGVLPQSLRSLKKLRYFNVRGNNFNGTIPDFIDQWQNLHIMNMMGNNFSAPLPGQISKLKNLQELYISDLVGESSPFPDLSGMNSLRFLTLRNCLIVGRIPPEISKLPLLQYLDLSFNSLSGGILPALSSSTLKHIFLRRNKLSGTTIPSAWLNTNRTYVDVSENFFGNVIMNSSNQNLNSFECCTNGNHGVANWDQDDLHCSNSNENDRLYINCGGNSLSINGRDYEADENKPGGSTFFKSKSSNWAYSSMGTFLWSSRDNYKINDTCQIHVDDAQLYSTARVSPISLKYYGFCLKTGMYNVRLHFAEISSRKSKSLRGNAERIFNVDIQGENVLKDFCIEREAKGINKPKIVEHKIFVNNSRLEIHLYWSGKGSVLYPSSYYGPLISAISVTTDQSVLPSRVIAGISGFALFLLILVIGFIWRSEDKLRQEERELVELYPGGLYNYRKIKAATKNFASENRLGKGGFGTVYKGTLSNGTLIAVKKLSATKEGMNEFLEKSGKIKGMEHQNLVTLMGCCAGKNQLLLVYKYNGDMTLQDALFGSDEVRARLDWPTRYKICLGLAEGLAFLHEGSEQEIIHGDIKPANIIIDDALNPKISDFARHYDKQRSESTTSYTAPEVGDRPLAASADVYSFGVVLLILVSGRQIMIKRAGGDTEYLVDEAETKHRKGILMGLVDQNLDYVWEEAELILRLAIACIDKRRFRPTMSTVVKILKKECPIESILVNASNPEVVRPT